LTEAGPAADGMLTRMTSPYSQHDHQVRLEWGPVGAAEIATDASYAVVVDVLSFTTTLSVAMDLDAEVLPYRWHDDSAVAYAAERDATLAVGRLEALDETRPGFVSLSPVSLSPASLRRAARVERLVLPSPNGSAISFALADGGATVVGASLRNRTAVAGWLRSRLRPDEVVAVVAAGERWGYDGSLRPALEDLLGAGAVIDALADHVKLADLSPEAAAAAAVFRDVVAREAVATALRACSGGQELIGKGFGDDVEVATELDSSPWVPVLSGTAYRRG